MDTAAVDPRDETWQVVQPKCRGYFHNADGSSDEYELADADVLEVISWAETAKGDRTYVLHACVPRDVLGLVRLVGCDPNAA